MQKLMINMKYKKYCLLIFLLINTFVFSKEKINPPPPKAYNDEPIEARYDDPNDPFEGINRLMWRFNYNFADRYILRPVAVGYYTVTPTFLQKAVMNFSDNLEEPSSAVNNLLQLHFVDSFRNLSRFSINITFGIFGTIDAASFMGIGDKKDGFDEVLAVYGVPDGPFLMLPGYGPTTIRELSGDFVDELYFPMTIFSFYESLALYAVDGLNSRVALTEFENVLYNSIDPYAFTKNAYFQNVQWKVYDGDIPANTNPNEEDLNSYLEELDY